MIKEKNIILTGFGGQGIISLSHILSYATLFEGYEVKTSENHGHGKRGGSVEVHIRIGPYNSPVIPKGFCDLLISFNPVEAFNRIDYLNYNSQIILKSISSDLDSFYKILNGNAALNILREMDVSLFHPEKKFFSLSDVFHNSVFLGILISKNFLFISEDSIKKAFACFFQEEILNKNLLSFNKGRELRLQRLDL